METETQNTIDKLGLCSRVGGVETAAQHGVVVVRVEGECGVPDTNIIIFQRQQSAWTARR